MSNKEKQETTAATPTPKNKYDYITIEAINNKFESGDSLDKINLYAVISFIKPPNPNNKNCTTFTLVDNTCTNLDCMKLKSNDFTGIEKYCNVGDIVRIHRFKVQSFHNSPQGVVVPKMSSLIRFKLNDEDFSYEGNHSPSSAITFGENDKVKVKALRDWVKSDQKVAEFLKNETQHNFFSNNNNNNYKDSKMSSNMQTSFPIINPIKISQVSQNSFFDIILQICGICKDVNGITFLMVWDGTKSNFVMHKRTISSFISRQTLNAHGPTLVDDNKVFFR